MTKFTTLTSSSKKIKETVFKYAVDCNNPGAKPRIGDTAMKPKDFLEVVYLGCDKAYGDVFLARPETPSVFWIFFGEAGDEFNNTEQ